MDPDRPASRVSFTPVAWLFAMLLALPLWPIALPLAGLLSVPLLAGWGLFCLARGADRLRRGLGRGDRAVLLGAGQSLAQAVLCAAFLAILSGIAMNVDVALAGAPPTAEEKAIGRRRAYAGGAVGLVAAAVAYALDPGRACRRDVAARKHETDPLA